MSIFKKLLLVFSFTLVSHYAHAQVTVDVILTPAGSFKAKTTAIKGHATNKGGVVSASNIEVDLNTLKTGINLRDEHTKKHLEASKYPKAKLISAKGSGGKGEAVIEIKGIQKKVSGEYKIEDNKLDATFPIKLSDFKITGIRYMGVGVKDEVKINVIVPIK